MEDNYFTMLCWFLPTTTQISQKSVCVYLLLLEPSQLYYKCDHRKMLFFLSNLYMQSTEWDIYRNTLRTSKNLQVSLEVCTLSYILINLKVVKGKFSKFTNAYKVTFWQHMMALNLFGPMRSECITMKLMVLKQF